MWFLVIYSIITWTLILFCLPETLKSIKPLLPEGEGVEGASSTRPSLSRVNSRRSTIQKSKRLLRILQRVFIDPFRIVYYLRFPAVAITVYYAAITFGSLYVLQVSIQWAFTRPPYNFTSVEVGLSYLSNSTGYFVASVLGGKWTDRIMAREAKKANRYDEHGQLIYRPEDRMRENMWLAAFMYPASLIWYGWTAEKQVHWIAPVSFGCLGGTKRGVSNMLIEGLAPRQFLLWVWVHACIRRRDYYAHRYVLFQPNLTRVSISELTRHCLVEFMPKRASSGVALNNLCRNTCSCIGGIVAEPLLAAIGLGWTFTGIGVIAGGSSIIIWAMKHYGPKWRKTMDEKMT